MSFLSRVYNFEVTETGSSLKANNLRIESRFAPEVIAQLRAAGHDVDVVGAFDQNMGHAGALVLHTTGPRAGTMEGASDPRSDGAAAGY